MSRLRPALPLLSVLLILVANRNLAADPGCIEGRVLDSAGSPVPATYVTVMRLDHNESTQGGTDGDGGFRIDYLLAGEQYEVLAGDNPVDLGISFSEIKAAGAVETKAGAEDRCSRVTLLQPARAHLSVRATDMFTGEPVKSVHAHFRFDSDKSWRGAIDEHGELLVPPSSELDVQVGATGYEKSGVLKVTTPQAGGADEVAVEMRPVQMGCIAGTVLDLEGKGVPGADIQTDSSEENFKVGTRIFTDANGKFRISGIQPANYWIFVNATDYPPPLTQKGSSVQVTVPPELNCADATVRLGPKAAKLKVTVINGMTQEPVDVAVVWSSGEYKPQGSWSQRLGGDLVPVPALTQITVNARAENYENSEPFTILPMQPGQTQEITIALKPKSLP